MYYGGVPPAGYPGYPQQPSYPAQPVPGGYPGYPPQQPGAYPGYPPQRTAPTAPPTAAPGYPPQNSAPTAPPAASPYGAPPAGYPQASQQGTYWYQNQYGPPPDEVTQMFRMTDRDGSGFLDLHELAGLVFAGRRFSYSTIRKVLRIFDQQRSRRADYTQFSYMHAFITAAHRAFTTIVPPAGPSVRPELPVARVHEALNIQGLQISPQIAAKTVEAFRANTLPPQGAPAAQPSLVGLDFDEYLEIAAHFAFARSLFEWRDPSKSGKITLTKDEFFAFLADVF